MIISKEVDIIINSNHLEYYKSLGYDVKFRKKLLINPIYLPKHSRTILTVVCDKCNKNIQYR
jgi:hypothetical protein